MRMKENRQLLVYLRYIIGNLFFGGGSIVFARSACRDGSNELKFVKFDFCWNIYRGFIHKKIMPAFWHSRVLAKIVRKSYYSNFDESNRLFEREFYSWNSGFWVHKRWCMKNHVSLNSQRITLSDPNGRINLSPRCQHFWNARIE